MPMNWTIDAQPDHVSVRIEGQWQTASIRRLIDEMERASREAGCGRILCDMRSVLGPLAREDRYLAGVHLAERLKQTKVAVVAPASIIDQFAARIANQHGARMLSTANIAEARRWLFGESQGS